MTYTTIKRITAAIQVGKGKELPREELYIELSVGNTVERSPVVQMTKKGSFNHTFTSDLEAGELLTLKIIRNVDQSLHGTLELTYEEVAEASGKGNYDFLADGHKVGSIDLDITVMARVHTNVIDSSIDFLASPLPWFLKAEDIYGLAKKGVTYAHSLPYTDKVVDSLESLTEALLQHTALIHPDEGSTCLTALDDLVAQTLATADDRLDNGRMRVLDSVRGLINAMERNVTEQREKIQNMATDLQGQVKSRVSSTVTMTQEKMMTTLALYEERYPSLAAKARSAIAQAHSMALGAQQLLTTATEYYTSTKNSVNEAYTQTQATVQKYYDAVTDTVVKAPGLACQTLDQGTELVRDLPLVGVYAAPCMSTAAGVIRYFANAPPAATTTAVAVEDE